MRITLLALLMAASALQADVRTEMGAIAQQRQSDKAQQLSLPGAPAKAARAQASLATRAAADAYADIRSATYNFEWMLFSGGWFWDSDTSYGTFDLLWQEYNDLSTYAVTVSLYVFLTTEDPQKLDQQQYIANQSNQNFTGYDNATPDSIAGNAAFLNSYAYTSSGFDWSYDKWYFGNSGVTYCFEIFSTLEDYNDNQAVYLFMKDAGLSFTPSGATKRTAAAAPLSGVLRYRSAPNGTVVFDIPRPYGELYLYDFGGRLLRTLSGTNVWDGRDSSGNAVGSGYVVARQRLGESSRGARILMK